MIPEIVRRAKVHLEENPYDSLHGVLHHQAVWENCLWIIDKEKLGVDVEALEIAAWWHDVERGSETNDLFLRDADSFGFPDELKNKVVSIINEHSFEQKQTLLESKVLYDADKLEYLSPLRLEQLLELYRTGNSMDSKRLEHYKKEWGRRINVVRNNLHFDSTRQEFEKRLI